MGILKGVALGSLGLIAAIVYLGVARKDGRAREVQPPEEPAPAAAIAVPQPATPTTTNDDRGFDEAVAFALEAVEPTHNVLSAGAQRMALWAPGRMKLEDVRVTDETAPRKILKDWRAEVGKRFCVRGEVLEIERADGIFAASFVGTLSDRHSTVRFVASGPTDGIVADERARFCGVNFGVMSYDTAIGGTNRAIVMVGMFDLRRRRPRYDEADELRRMNEGLPPLSE